MAIRESYYWFSKQIYTLERVYIIWIFQRDIHSQKEAHYIRHRIVSEFVEFYDMSNNLIDSLIHMMSMIIICNYIINKAFRVFAFC